MESTFAPLFEAECAGLNRCQADEASEILTVKPERPGGGPSPSGTVYTARIAALEAEIQALRNENARAHQILRSAVDYAIITMDNQGCIVGWNAGAQNITGHTEADVLGLCGDIVFTAEDRDSGRFTLELCRALEQGRANNERWHIRRDGTRFWASGLMMPLLDADGQPNGYLNILRDRSDVRAQTECRELLMAEMNHRVKNTFALVQAIAGQTRRHARTNDEFQTAFTSRLAALARSHNLLISGKWEEAPLREVIEGALAPYGEGAGRATIEGPSVLLAANLVVTLTLAFHELATNATKHGALSVPAGAVHVSWRIVRAEKGAPQVELFWQERGGPPVGQPERQGFGSHLLSRGLNQFGGSLRQDFQPDGLECHICFPLGANEDGKRGT